jgi:NADH-quinone oxidoreductase subunit M
MGILTANILVPFLGVFLLVALPSGRSNLIRVTAIGIGSLSFLLSVVAFLGYDYKEGGYQLRESYEWLPNIGIGFTLGVDGISAVLILLNGFIFLAGIVMSWAITPRNKDFFILLFLLAAGVYGTFAVLDLFFLFFFYELAVVPMFLLIGVWGSSSDFGYFARTKEYGAMKLVLYLTAGSMLVWLAIIAIFVEAGLGTFNMESLASAELSRTFQIVFFPFVAVGFGVLSGLWPFHTWSPDGHVAAPTAVSMLHAGVLMKLGAYGILKVGMFILPEGAIAWAPVLIGLGTVNVLYGAIGAISQTDLKYVIAYSSVSHMGYVIMGLATLDPIGINGSVLQMVSHGIMTALFFALVGGIYQQAHLRDIRVLEGLAKRMGVTAAFFGIAGLTSLGLPGFSGFVAEFMVFVGTFRTYPFLGVLAVIGAAITAVYILRLMSKVFFGPLDDQWAHLSDPPKYQQATAGVLAVTLLGIGIWPFPLIRVIDVGVADLLRAMGGM